MSSSITTLITKCKSLKSLKSIHAHLIITNTITTTTPLILNKLLRLYSRFHSLQNSRKLFDQIPDPNPHLYTALIHALVEHRHFTEAHSLFKNMLRDNVTPLNFTIASLFKGLVGMQKNGDGVFGFSWKCGLEGDLVVQNSVMDFYMKCGKVELAERVFGGMREEERDVVSWNTMVSGFVSNGRVYEAERVFEGMPERNVVSWTCLIDGFVKIGDMVKAEGLFERMPVKDSVVWRVMVSGFVEAGDFGSARRVFEGMPKQDVGSWNVMVSGFCRLGDVGVARGFFDRMPMRNDASWGIMIDGYVKVGDTDAARCLFDQAPEKNLVCWSTMIGGYAKNGNPREALEMYKSFKKTGMKADEGFILAVLSACSQLGTLDAAESVVSDYVGPSLFYSLRVVTSLIDMYAKCGSIERAKEVFEMVDVKDSHCYSAMIAAFANHGLSQDAISLFEEMQKKNIKPDGITFIGVLGACNHGGLVNQGRKYFKQMIDEYAICPSEKHYACVVDLLGRAGCLGEAYELIAKMPITPTAAVWGALLAACKNHLNVELGEIAATELLKIEPENSGNYILLSNIYAAAGRWDGVAKVRAMIKEHKVRKNRGSSWIELGSVVHEFVMGDVSHFACERIYLMMDLINLEMEALGCARENGQSLLSASHSSIKV